MDSLNNDSFLDMTDEDVDNLLLGVEINDDENNSEELCINCNSSNIIIDEINSCKVCEDCGL